MVFKGINVGNFHHVTHLLFVDDILIFMKVQGEWLRISNKLLTFSTWPQA
jgi:hypothetical protein